MDWFLTVAISVVFSLVGLAMLSGYGAGMVLPKGQDKDKYDTLAMCRDMGRLMLAMALLNLLMSIGRQSHLRWLHYGAAGCLALCAVGYFIYANTGGRYLKK